MRSILKVAFVAFVAIAAANEVRAQSVLQDGSTVQGHLVAATPPGGAPPTVANCTLTAGSTDMIGGCAATAAAGVAVTFNKPFAKAPFCVVLDHTTSSGNALAVEPTTTGFTLGTTVNADKISWICMGQVGN